LVHATEAWGGESQLQEETGHLMRFKRFATRLAVVAGLVATMGMTQALAQSVFGDKLGFVARNNANQETILGTGWVRATLDGNVLVVEGQYSGLGSPATAAHIHLAPPGQHGPVVFPLEFTAAADGTLSGTFELNDAQLAELLAHNLYVNVHTQANPGGQIRAWLMPIE
jgi:hypothetical protein